MSVSAFSASAILFLESFKKHVKNWNFEPLAVPFSKEMSSTYGSFTLIYKPRPVNIPLVDFFVENHNHSLNEIFIKIKRSYLPLRVIGLSMNNKNPDYKINISTYVAKGWKQTKSPIKNLFIPLLSVDVPDGHYAMSVRQFERVSHQDGKPLIVYQNIWDLSNDISEITLNSIKDALESSWNPKTQKYFDLWKYNYLGIDDQKRIVRYDNRTKVIFRQSR